VSRVAAAERFTDRLGPWPILPWVVPLIAVLLSRLQVGDLAYQLRAGRIMWDSRAVLRTDIFTYTIPGAPWLDQQWGAQLAFSGWFQVAGWRGLIVLQAAILAGCFGATYRCTVAQGASALAASCATLLAFAAAATLPGTLALRPQLLALPLFVSSAWLIRRRLVVPGAQLFLVPIGVVWANVHGSFVLLTVLLAIALAADLIARRTTVRWTGALLAISLVTPLVSPWGATVYRYVWDLARSPIVREAIAEWRPLWTEPPAAIVFVAVCAVAAIVLARRATRRLTFEEAVTLVVFTGLALWSGRNLLWWAAVVPPVLGGALAGWRPGGDWSRTATRLVVACVAAVVVLGGFRVATSSIEDLRTEAPPGITAWLAGHVGSRERVFAEWWGGWFEYAVPAEPMFIDARVEIFPPQVWVDYSAIVDVDPNWGEVIHRWGIDTIVLARGHHPELENTLRSDASWSLVYEDADGYVFTRR
jgi:hypothetical protein